MRRAVVYGIKGGIGKSTIAVNMAFGLAERGLKVALIDLDPQCDSTDMSGCDATAGGGMWSVLTEGVPLESIAIKINSNLEVYPGNKALAVIDQHLIAFKDPGIVLSERMKHLKHVDFVIMDSAPGYSILNQNALVYAREAWLPCAMEYLSMRGVAHVVEVLDMLREARGESPPIRFVIPMFYNARTRVARESLEAIRESFPGNLTPPIRRSVRVSEAAGFKKSIFEYDRKGECSMDFQKLVDYIYDLEMMRR